MIESITNIDSILSQEVYCTHKGRGCRKTLLLSELEVSATNKKKHRSMNNLDQFCFVLFYIKS